MYIYIWCIMCRIVHVSAHVIWFILYLSYRSYRSHHIVSFMSCESHIVYVLREPVQQAAQHACSKARRSGRRRKVPGMMPGMFFSGVFSDGDSEGYAEGWCGTSWDVGKTEPPRFAIFNFGKTRKCSKIVLMFLGRFSKLIAFSVSAVASG